MAEPKRVDLSPAHRMVIALVALATVISGPSKAQSLPLPTFYDGNELLRLCSDPAPTSAVACHLFIAGIYDTMVVAEGDGKGVMGWRVCLRSGVILDQLVDIVVRLLREHPEWRHTVAAALVARALAETFPCSGTIQKVPVP